jgi:hypothetical protein
MHVGQSSSTVENGRRHGFDEACVILLQLVQVVERHGACNGADVKAD